MFTRKYKSFYLFSVIGMIIASIYPLMMGIMIFMSGLALLANLVTDLCYGLLDPRVTLGES